jgi:hypothetical protein
MLSSGVANIRFARLGAPRRGRPGINPTVVRRASIDRLEWIDLGELAAESSHRSGWVEPQPIAAGQHSALHRAIDWDGDAALVRRASSNLIEAFAASHAAVADLEDRAGMSVPVLRAVTDHDLWLDRPQWQSGRPTAHAVDAYVRALLVETCADGTVVATGEPHLLADGALVCEDVAVAARLEPDERACIRGIIGALIVGDVHGVTDAVTTLCRGHAPGLVGAIRRSAIALTAEWTPTSFGLSLHQISCAASAVGPRSEPLVLLADELLHRLDLAFTHHELVPCLASPARVAELIAPRPSNRETA